MCLYQSTTFLFSEGHQAVKQPFLARVQLVGALQVEGLCIFRLFWITGLLTTWAWIYASVRQMALLSCLSFSVYILGCRQMTQLPCLSYIQYSIYVLIVCQVTLKSCYSQSICILVTTKWLHYLVCPIVSVSWVSAKWLQYLVSPTVHICIQCVRQMALLSCLSYSICILGVRQMSLLFRYQEDGSNKLMHGASKSQVWFIFTCIQKSHYFYRSSTLQYLHDIQLTPCISNRTTLLYLIGELASLLVVTNAHPPLSLVCQQLPFPLLCPSHPFTPYSSSYTIYIDNINNISVVFIWDIYYLVCPTISVSWVSAR